MDNTDYMVTSLNKVPTLTLVGDIQGMSHDVYKLLSFNLNFMDGRVLQGFAKLKWQGDGSLQWVKKNFKLKTYVDDSCQTKLKFKPLADWASNNEFNLKANYMDLTHARNITNAKLFARMTATRSNVDETLLHSINFSQIQGFPIHLLVNGKSQGLYTLNTGKNSILFNMDKSSLTQASVEAAQYNDTTRFITANPKFDGTDFTVEFPDIMTDSIKNSFINLMNFVNVSNPSAFRADQDQYLDVNSVIDFGLFSNVIEDTDMNVKNAMYVTYDGKKWMMVPYDLDTSWALQWDGKSLQNVDQDLFNFQGNQLLQKTFESNQDLVYRRYHDLRTGILRADNIINAFKNFMKHVGETQYENDLDIWPSLPSQSLTGMAQLQYAIYKRLEVVDQQIEKHFGGGRSFITPNYVKNSDAKFDLTDWKTVGTFYRTSFSTSINNGSMGIGCWTTGLKENTWSHIESKQILIQGPNDCPVVSFGGKILVSSGVSLTDEDFIGISIRFRDSNQKEISNVTVAADKTLIDFPQMLKAENIKTPQGTSWIQFEFNFSRNGHAILTQPQLNFTPTLGQYSSCD
ncbi:MAG TPA: hypothetical protein DCW31_05050 [Lactobacillus sp.]|nr:hypothetical protein [Lactobacillus sp.]